MSARDGQYSFDNLFRGLYRVRQAVPAGSLQTTPDPADIDLFGGQDYVASADQAGPADQGTSLVARLRVWPSAACNGP